MADRRLRDAAIVLPAIGVLLFLPPWIRLFDHALTVFGIPLLLAGLFGVWLTGIILTAVMARKLSRQEAPEARRPASDTLSGQG